MKILITGIAGFAGSTLARSLLESCDGVEIIGIDNLMRPGSETNRPTLRKLGVQFVHGDIRCPSDVDSLLKTDWVIDAAANPSVLAGLAGSGSTRQLFEHNLASLINILEYCRRHSAGLLLLSTSRVYSIPLLRYPQLAKRLIRSAQLGLRTNSSGVNGMSTIFKTRTARTGNRPAKFSTASRCHAAYWIKSQPHFLEKKPE
jgi:nucleoside-diphosphate-sugar epimerase